MTQPHYAIMRFAKYKGPEITNIEAHNERRKEKYASNPDIDQSHSKYNFHLVEPSGRYRAEAESQINAAGCRTRTDSVRVVEVLFTATPDFFKGKKLPEIRQYFEEAEPPHIVRTVQKRGLQGVEQANQRLAWRSESGARPVFVWRRSWL